MLIKALCVQLAVTRMVVRGAFALGVAGGVAVGAAGALLPVAAVCAARRMGRGDKHPMGRASEPDPT
ncbi:hypothetical protein ACQW02_20155 [Humitalea sp. 24SJ18S-53]|uniref:hypothetical protein n=1 Tax=Humitalea sp. 24SJ18S-53 TaxID=3422307 RepID=UPI003D67BCD6